MPNIQALGDSRKERKFQQKQAQRGNLPQLAGDREESRETLVEKWHTMG